MKTRRLTTVLTSTCLLVMLALSVMPIRSNAADTNNAPTKVEPVMTEELMNRLIKRALASKIDTYIGSDVCELFSMRQPAQNIPAKQVIKTVPEGTHNFTVPLREGSTDVIIGFITKAKYEYYLTDKTGKLRAASIADEKGARLITNEAAAEKFKSEMQLFAKAAEKLPPSTEENPPVEK